MIGRIKNLGDAIEDNPVVHAIGKITGCVDPETDQLKPESPCAKAKERLNNGENLFTVMYDRFFSRTKGEQVKFILQVEVESEDLKSAINQVNGGTIIAANPRPIPPQRPAQSPALAARTGQPQASA